MIPRPALLSPSPLASLLAALLSGLISGALGAQNARFEDVTPSHYAGESRFACMDADAGDADGDGDLDLALAVEFGPNILLLNDGEGFLAPVEPSRLPITRHDSEDVRFADFDGDGDLDLIFVSEDDQTNEFYLNDGRGHYNDASDRIPVTDVSNAVAVTDIDGDGDSDILIGNIGLNRILINDGNANFMDRTESLWPANNGRTQDLEAVDIDSDGDIDIVEANEGPNRIYLNDGGGTLTRADDLLPAIEDESREIRAADFNGDGLLDLAVANVQSTFNWEPHDYILFNNGDNTFHRSSENDHPAFQQNHFTIQTDDLDRDGDIDLILPHVIINGAGNFQIMLNNGGGRFFPAAENSIFPGMLTGNGFDIEVADFNGDGEDDLFLCNRLAPQSLLFHRE